MSSVNKGWGQQGNNSHQRTSSKDRGSQRNSSKDRSHGRNSSKDRPYNNTQQNRSFETREKSAKYIDDQKQKFKPDARANFHKSFGKKLKKFTPIKFVEVKDARVTNELQRSIQEQRHPPTVTVDDIVSKSVAFWDNFPSNTARLHVLLENNVPKEKLQEFAESVYPIVHHSTLCLIVDFLDFKKRYGSPLEKSLYDGMSLLAFVDRLLKCRPLAFLGSNDHYLLEKNLHEGYGGFEAIGSSQEQYPLILQDFLSYDEMRISSLVSLSSWSIFVNDGRRKNYGKKDKDGYYQPEGVIVGQVGTRLKRQGVMEYIDCIVLKEENCPEKGYGSNNIKHVNSVWSKLWGNDLPTYAQASDRWNQQRDNTNNKAAEGDFEYLPIGKDTFLNVTVYKKRIAITAEILLNEANSRARTSGKLAYVHVVGLGLGVWKATDKQLEIYIEAWGDAMSNISNTKHIGHVDFSYIDCFEVHGVKTGEKFPNTNITVHFSKRNLHDKVPQDCILVCNYAWDGNSLPGNEFWLGKSCSTGDSAAACSSCVAEIHNHLFNPVVGAEMLRIATPEGNLVHWKKYLPSKSGKPNASGSSIASPVASQHIEHHQTPPLAPLTNNWVPDPATMQTATNGIQQTSITAPQTNELAPTNNSLSDSSVEQTSDKIQQTSITQSQTAFTASQQRPTTITKEVPAHNEISFPAAKKSKQSDIPSASQPVTAAIAVVEVVKPEPPPEPEFILHATIPGQTIPNPKYKKPPGKAKSPKKGGNSNSNNTNKDQCDNKKQGGGSGTKTNKSDGKNQKKEGGSNNNKNQDGGSKIGVNKKGKKKSK